MKDKIQAAIIPDSAGEEEETCLEAEPSPAARSDLAEAVERLKSASMGAAKKRGRLPQPLFWSLFHSEISRLKKIKARRRFLDSLFGDEPLE